MDLTIDISRLWGELETLAAYSDAPAPAVTRVLYTEVDRGARSYLKELFAQAGLAVREDALGNTFARWQGTEADLTPVASGSHIDAIPHSGRFDGTVGVLGALEAFRALTAADFAPRRSIDLILFTAEEPTRFGLGCLGSKALAGVLSPSALRALRDDEGKSPDQARREAGFGGQLEEVALPDGHYHAFVELHIEQGPLLEQDGVAIGVVEAIAAPATLRLTLRGEGGHAGAVLMPQRKDALTAGAEITLAVEAAAKGSGSTDSVATIGILDVHPRAVNSIPSEVVLTADVRDIDLERRDRMVAQIREAATRVVSARGIELGLEVINADDPARCAPEVIAAVRDAATAAGVSSTPLISRAYHDASFMARICPTGMIFIPCRGGVSHRPDEYVSPAALEAGVRVLARTLARLAG